MCGVCLLGECVYVCAWCVSVYWGVWLRECTCRGSTTGGPWLAMLTCVGSLWLIEPTMMSWCMVAEWDKAFWFWTLDVCKGCVWRNEWSVSEYHRFLISGFFFCIHVQFLMYLMVFIIFIQCVIMCNIIFIIFFYLLQFWCINYYVYLDVLHCTITQFGFRTTKCILIKLKLKIAKIESVDRPTGVQIN